MIVQKIQKQVLLETTETSIESKIFLPAKISERVELSRVVSSGCDGQN